MITSRSPWYKIVIYGLEKLGRYYSSYRAFVVDNDDPLKHNRVRIVSPIFGMYGNQGIWAYPKSQWGGNNYGMNIFTMQRISVYI